MKTGLDFSIDLSSFSTHHTLPGELATRLSELCSTLSTLYAGQPTDLSSVAEDFSNLAQWLKNRAPAGPDDPDWTVQILSFPGGAGGQAIFTDQQRSQQSLTLCLDGSGRPISGIWQSLRPGDEARAFSFQMENQALLIEDGRRQSRHALPGAAQLRGWGSLASFAGALFGLLSPAEESAPPVQPEPMAAPATPTPVVSFTPPVMPKPVAPKPVTPAPAASIACPTCGTLISPNARFCSNCGAEISAPPVEAPRPKPVAPQTPRPAAPETAWYYIDKGKRAGPIDETTIRRWVRERRLRPESQVWNASLPNWVEVRQTALIAEAPQAKPASPARAAAAPVTPQPPVPAWYYLVKGVQAGPVDEVTLRRWFAERRLPPNTLVWNPSLSGWIPASQAGFT